MKMLVICLASMLWPMPRAWAGDEPMKSEAIQSVPFTRVHFDDGFWKPRLDTNRDVTVWYDFRKCEQTNRIRNFEAAGGLVNAPFDGIFYNDSDVYKVIEGASYTLATRPDAKLEAYLDDLIAKIAAAQEDDGYLYTMRTIEGANITDANAGRTRWSHLGMSHELYNVGHLYEAAVAHFQATGKRTLLDVAIKNADLLCRTFGPDKLIAVPGHEEVEIGLVKLWRVTAEQKYLDLARFFIDMRGRSDLREVYGTYAQDDVPVIEQTEPEGHAVRAGYLYAGMADVASIAHVPEYVTALDRIWDRLVSRRMYLTGGIGAQRHTEGFGRDYDLPNADAYNETCAAVASCLWNYRMFLLHGDAKYMDVFERTAYNGFLSGVSFSGDRFFYPNPLACDGVTAFNFGTLGRAAWFGTSCCPVNVVRFLPSLPGYAYAARGDDIYINLFVQGVAEIATPGGPVSLDVRTEYPWSGLVHVRMKPDTSRRFALRVRVPGWSRGEPVPSDLYAYVNDDSSAVRFHVNRQAVTPRMEQGYAVIERQWSPGDEVSFQFEMPVRYVRANEQVVADRGLVAIERGPLVYCFEATDNGGRVSDLVLDPSRLANSDDAIAVMPAQDLNEGCRKIELSASRAVRGDDGAVRLERDVHATAIPYYAWANRDVGEMAVWVATGADQVHLPPPPTIASRATVRVSHCYGNDTPSAINDQREPASSDDASLPRMTWWDHRGTSEWAELELDEPTDVSSVEVYWFDDSGHGLCRVPASWRLMYRDGDAWKPVEPDGGFGVERDRFNKVSFAPVRTSALRVEVRLRDGFSGGILEWKVE